jgi:hypothetical protein
MGVHFKALQYFIQNYTKKFKKFFFGQFEYFEGSNVVNKLFSCMFLNPNNFFQFEL